MPSAGPIRRKPERSDAQRRQARTNGAKSRGPTTDAGKAISSRNAVRHGFRSEKTVSEQDRPRYEAIRDAILNDLPRSPRTNDALLAENVAAAVIQVEAICSARIAAVAEKKRRIRRDHKRRNRRAARQARRAVRDGNRSQAHAILRRSSDGCVFLAAIWTRIRDRLAALPPAQTIPSDLRTEIQTHAGALDPHDQSRFRHLETLARETGGILAGQMTELCEHYVHTLEIRVVRIMRQNRRSLRAQFHNAEADLDHDGELLARYLNMARSAIIRNARRLDLETHRHWHRERTGKPTSIEPENVAPNEPENLPQSITDSGITASRNPEDLTRSVGSLTTAGGSGNLSKSTGPDAGPQANGSSQRSSVDEPVIGQPGSLAGKPPAPPTVAPNEPESSSQAIIYSGITESHNPKDSARSIGSQISTDRPGDSPPSNPTAAPNEPRNVAPSEPRNVAPNEPKKSLDPLGSPDVTTSRPTERGGPRSVSRRIRRRH